MYMYVGGEHVLRLEEVVAVIDVRTSMAPATREFLQLSRVEGRLIDVPGGKPKSCVIARDRIYLSPLSTPTLTRRRGKVQGRFVLYT